MRWTSRERRRLYERLLNCTIYLYSYDGGYEVFSYGQDFRQSLGWTFCDDDRSFYGYALVDKTSNKVSGIYPFRNGPFRVQRGDFIRIDLGNLWFENDAYDMITVKELFAEFAEGGRKIPWARFGF